jgi:hypothetical protein
MICFHKGLTVHHTLYVVCLKLSARENDTGLLSTSADSSSPSGAGVYVEIFDSFDNGPKHIKQRWKRLVGDVVDEQAAVTEAGDVGSCGDQPDYYICDPSCGYINMWGISAGAPVDFPHNIVLKGWREDGIKHLALGPYKGFLDSQLSIITRRKLRHDH